MRAAADDDELERASRRSIELAIETRQRELEEMAFVLADSGVDAEHFLELMYDADDA